MKNHSRIPRNVTVQEICDAINAVVTSRKRNTRCSAAQMQIINFEDLGKYPFFTADIIRELENKFEKDTGYNPCDSPNAQFGARLKQLSIEASAQIEIHQIYYKVDNTKKLPEHYYNQIVEKQKKQESFSIKDDNNDNTQSALWVIENNNQKVEVLKHNFF